MASLGLLLNSTLQNHSSLFPLLSENHTSLTSAMAATTLSCCVFVSSGLSSPGLRDQGKDRGQPLLWVTNFYQVTCLVFSKGGR